MEETKHFTTGSCKPIFPDDGVFRLYSMRFCPYAHRVHLVLDAKNIPHYNVFINLQAKPEWFVKMNKTGMVPALELVKEGGNPVLVESLVICDYLDEMYPDVPLYPKDPLKKAQDKILINRFGQFISATYKLLLDAKPDLDLAALNDGLDIYENELKQRGSNFFGGSKPGMLDYMIWPWCERFAALKRTDGTPAALNPQRFVALLKWRDLMVQDKAVKVFYLDGETHGKYMSSRRAPGQTDYDMLYHASKRIRLD